mgnify:CR=1 FL=1
MGNPIVWRNILWGVVAVVVMTVILNYTWLGKGCMINEDGRSVSIVHMGASK